MTCRDVRELADSFLSEELLTETNHEILRHLETCPSCRADLDGRRRLRASLRAAFERAPDLAPRPEFTARLREQLLQERTVERTRRTLPRQWFALAAGVMLAVGLALVVLFNRSVAPADALARDAVGDHQNCALQFRLAKLPIPLDAAAAQFDSAYRVLLTSPPDDVQTPDGELQVTDRHSCAYGTRRFGHVVMKYRGHVVSLLMTASSDHGDDARDAVAREIGGPVNGFSVVSVNGLHHAIVMVADLDGPELTALSNAVAVPLAQRLTAAGAPTVRMFTSLLFDRLIQPSQLNEASWSRPEPPFLQ